MIYSLLIYLLLIWQQYEVLNGYSFLFSSVKHKCRRIYVHSSKQQDTASPTFVSVRFINTIKNEDITVESVLVGANLLAVGDQAGVKLPRACRTGLCGSCTCDLQISDFQLETDDKTDSLLQKSGFTTIRACSTKCQAPPGMKEMVIDVYRMKTLTKKSASSQAQQDYVILCCTQKTIVVFSYSRIDFVYRY